MGFPELVFKWSTSLTPGIQNVTLMKTDNAYRIYVDMEQMWPLKLLRIGEPLEAPNGERVAFLFKLGESTLFQCVLPAEIQFDYRYLVAMNVETTVKCIPSRENTKVFYLLSQQIIHPEFFDAEGREWPKR